MLWGKSTGSRQPLHDAVPAKSDMTSSTVARDLESAPAAAGVPLPDIDAVDALVGEMRAALKAEQRPDGHWLFELEADATIPAEYIFLQHFLGKVDTPGFRAVDPKIAHHLRATPGRHGGDSKSVVQGKDVTGRHDLGGS